MIRVGCQTNVWKREMDAGKSFWQVLDEARAAGAEGIEAGWWMIGEPAQDAARLQDELASRELGLASVFSAFRILDKPDEDELAAFRRACEVMSELGTEVAVVGLSAGERDADGHRRAANVLNAAGTIAADHGLVLGVHPHGVVETDADYAALAELCPAETVGFCADVGNLHRAGVNALTFCTRFKSRINYVHFKDYNGEFFVPLGAGDSSVAACARLLAAHGYSGWMIAEHETAYAREVGAQEAIRLDIDFISFEIGRKYK